ncbi:zinc-binding dehydrogenase [Paractinoplanes atraurantiacus]|uniref:NADPH:quinone reductase n=1 Tax=Paractinoplanes atraurantiacus TaxID=1036182 RepID=A0A285GJ36_9ACTN|nr:zinc-binding dehydrogenase [Actinoplanes atraurantiacus]SNY23610.1 NADPH:quinone reductase [Actinoplanes atraurantiacus]
MKAVVIKEFGSPDGLGVVELGEPVAGGGQVLVDVEAAGVAGGDVLIRRGALAAYGFRTGFVPGGEVAGTVAAVGAGVDPGWVGRRVWAFTGTGGGYAEKAVVVLRDVVALPDSVAAVDAVTLGSAGVVGHFGLAQARFAAGESVLVRGAAGSLGIATVQLAARGGASVVAVTTSSAERGRRLRELGATHVLDRAGVGDGPEAYDVIIDVVAGDGLMLDRLAVNGRLVIVGAVDGPPPADLGARLMAAFRKSLTVATFSADTVPAGALQAVRESSLLTLKSVVHQVLPLAEAAEAHRQMDAGQVFGRIVLTV